MLRWCPRSRQCEQEPRHGYDDLSHQSWPAILREDATLRPFPLELEYAGEAGLAPYPVSHKLHNLEERRNLRRSLKKRHPFDNVKCRGKRKKKSKHATARYKPQSASVSAPTTSTSAYLGKHESGVRDGHWDTFQRCPCRGRAFLLQSPRKARRFIRCGGEEGSQVASSVGVDQPLPFCSVASLCRAVAEMAAPSIEPHSG